MADERLVELARKLRIAKDLKEDLESQLKDVNKDIEQLAQRDIPTIMEAQEVTNIKIAGVGTIYLQNKVKASITADDKAEAYAWLSENGHGDLIKEYVHPKTLEAWAKEQIENNMPIPEEFIRAYKYTQAAIRRS